MFSQKMIQNNPEKLGELSWWLFRKQIEFWYILHTLVCLLIPEHGIEAAMRCHENDEVYLAVQAPLRNSLKFK